MHSYGSVLAEKIRSEQEVLHRVESAASKVNKLGRELKKNKVKLIDQNPRWFAEYKRNFAFIHPAATHGILTEIIDGKY